MAEGINDQTQRICESQPFCLCVGELNEWDECDCFLEDLDALFPTCAGCGAELGLINFETGEKLAA